jgi:hypothetical protein
MISGAEALLAPGRINPIYLEGKLLPLQAATAAELGLKDGQVVQASVKLQNAHLARAQFACAWHPSIASG